jgi:hypothetical protein
MRKTGRILTFTAVLGGVYLLLNGIGWAAVFFWKSQTIALIIGMVALVICPVEALEVVPRSSLDTPLFFVPMMFLCFILWAFAIEALWNWKRQRTKAARKQ